MASGDGQSLLAVALVPVMPRYKSYVGGPIKMVPGNNELKLIKWVKVAVSHTSVGIVERP
jgi:hypothetical protein